MQGILSGGKSQVCKFSFFFVAKKTAKQACHSYFAKKLYQSGFYLHFWISLLSTSQRYTQLCHQFYFKTTVPVNNLKSCITSTTIQNGLTGVLLKREKNTLAHILFEVQLLKRSCCHCYHSSCKLSQKQTYQIKMRINQNLRQVGIQNCR